MKTPLNEKQWQDLNHSFNRWVAADEQHRPELRLELLAAFPEIKQPLQAMIQNFEASKTFLESVPTPEFPARIGPYRLVREIGAGGMGVVFEAIRDDGEYEQKVALKLMRRDLHNVHLYEKFLQERRTLARLNHPGIVGLLEGGTTADGLSWFTMEYIEGQDLLSYVKSKGAALKERVGLIIQLCKAIEIAHQNLFVHRDLKPSNILVSVDGTVKILDFGIVKWLEQQDQTQTSILTPRYSAPEQILAEPITTATDIFTIGLLLVECITESHPFDDAHSVFELQKAIVSRTLSAPSKRLAKFPVAQVPAKAVRGDLDAICSKAVQIEPQKRYQSATQLATDLENCMQGLPVSARPVGRLGNSIKWMKRNPGISSLMILLFCSWLGATFTIVRSNRQIAAERKTAILERDRAAAIATFLENLFEQNSPESTLGKEPSALDLLENGKRLIGSSLDQSEERTQLLHSLCKVYFKLGQAKEALALSEQALPDLKGEVLAEHYLLRAEIFLSLGHYQESTTSSEAGLKMAQDLASSNLQALCLNTMGECFSKQGQHERAGQLFDRSGQFLGQLPPQSRLALLSNQANHAANVKNFQQSLDSFKQILALKKDLFPQDHPQIGLSYIQLGNAHRWVHDPESSKQHFEMGLNILNKVYPKGHGDLASAENDYAGLLRSLGLYTEARQHYELAMKWLTQFFGEDHPHTIMAKSNLGVFLLSAFEDLDGAIQNFDWAFQQAQSALPPDHQFLGEIRNNLAIAHERRGDLQLAQTFFEGCVAHYRSISGETPHPNLSAALCELGNFYGRTQQVESALAATREALFLRQKYAFGDAEQIYALQCLGQALLLAKQGPEAQDSLKFSADLLANHPQLKWESANQKRLEAEYAAAQGNWETVQQILETSLEKMEKYIGANHPNTQKARALMEKAHAQLKIKDN